MYIDAAGQKVYYEQAGSGDPLLLLHGWGVSGETFKPLFHRLADPRLAGSRLVSVMDFPGFGQSEPPPPDWGSVEFGELISDFLEKLDCGRTDIIAHSFGARAALRLCVNHPEKVNRLVLTGAAGIRPQRQAPFLKRMLGKTAKTFGKLGPPGEWIKRKIYGKIGSADYLNAGEMRPILVRVVNEDILPLLPKIKHETLLIWGEKDTETPPEMARKMNAGLSGSRLEIIKGAGHYAFADEPETFFNLVDSFLRSGR